jgi:hypothetical protein
MQSVSLQNSLLKEQGIYFRETGTSFSVISETICRRGIGFASTDPGAGMGIESYLIVVS